MNVVLVGRSFDALHRLRALHHQVFVLCEQGHAASLAAVEDQLTGWAVVESYASVESMWGALVRLKMESAIDAVVAGTELAVVSCAILAKLLNARGQNPRVALRCRDKAVQKQTWNSSGIRTTPWAVVSGSWTDQVTSAELSSAAVTFPAVCKPLASGGATMVFQVHSVVELRQVQATSPLLETMLVETYVSAEEWHFDGYVEDGRLAALMVSQYLEPLLLTKTGASVASVAYPPASHPELYAKAETFVTKTVKALGLETGVFHLEAFGDEQQWLPSELACRPGGSWISEIAHLTIGLDIWAAHVDLTLGRTPCQTKVGDTGSVYGLAHLPSRGGQVNSLDAEVIGGLPGVIRVHLKVPKGEVMSDSRESTGACRAAVVVRANSVESCRTAIVKTVQDAEKLDALQQQVTSRKGSES